MLIMILAHSGWVGAGLPMCSLPGHWCTDYLLGSTKYQVNWTHRIGTLSSKIDIKYISNLLWFTQRFVKRKTSPEINCEELDKKLRQKYDHETHTHTIYPSVTFSSQDPI